MIRESRVFRHGEVQDSVADKTLVVPTLAAAQTRLIPHTKNRLTTTSPINMGVNVYVYDIDLVSPSGAIVRVVSGYVEVNPACTN
jgi:hypothetical protein